MASGFPPFFHLTWRLILFFFSGQFFCLGSVKKGKNTFYAHLRTKISQLLEQKQKMIEASFVFTFGLKRSSFKQTSF